MTMQHCTEGMGEEKLYFPLLKSGKRQKAPLGRSVSTHFVVFVLLIASCCFSLPNSNKHLCFFFSI